MMLTSSSSALAELIAFPFCLLLLPQKLSSLSFHEGLNKAVTTEFKFTFLGACQETVQKSLGVASSFRMEACVDLEMTDPAAKCCGNVLPFIPMAKLQQKSLIKLLEVFPSHTGHFHSRLSLRVQYQGMCSWLSPWLAPSLCYSPKGLPYPSCPCLGTHSFSSLLLSALDVQCP